MLVHTVTQDKHAAWHHAKWIGKPHRGVLFAILYVLFMGFASANDILPEPAAALEIPTSPDARLSVLIDPSAALSHTDVIAPQRQTKFTSVNGSNVNFGYARNAVWLRLEVKTTRSGASMMSLAPNFIEFIDAYVTRTPAPLTTADLHTTHLAITALLPQTAFKV